MTEKPNLPLGMSVLMARFRDLGESAFTKLATTEKQEIFQIMRENKPLTQVEDYGNSRELWYGYNLTMAQLEIADRCITNAKHNFVENASSMDKYLISIIALEYGILGRFMKKMVSRGVTQENAEKYLQKARLFEQSVAYIVDQIHRSKETS